MPDVPHLTKNRLFEYLYACGRKNEYPFITNFTSFDFETLKNPVNKEISTKMQCEVSLRPISVGWTVVAETIDTKSMFIWSENEVDFINKWMDVMFEEAQKIYDIRESQIAKLRLTENLKKMLIKERETNVRILGFNSRKFDVNLFVNNLRDCKITGAIGSSTQYKSITISHKNYRFRLQFLDLQSFLAGGSLDENVKIFTSQQLKGVFPYEILNKSNFLDVLLKEEPFKKAGFWSDLTKTHISDERYQEYLEDQKKFKN
jgi:hypothetical protein